MWNIKPVTTLGRAPNGQFTKMPPRKNNKSLWLFMAAGLVVILALTTLTQLVLMRAYAAPVIPMQPSMYIVTLEPVSNGLGKSEALTLSVASTVKEKPRAPIRVFRGSSVSEE